MEKNKKVGRPKLATPKNVQIKITVTKEENARLEIIAKKLGIKKTELIRIFALGTDEKSPKDIYHHHKSFYPFLEGYLNLIDELHEHNLDLSDVADYEEYKVTLIEDNIINHFNEKLNLQDISNCRFTTIKELFNDDFIFLIGYNITGFQDIGDKGTTHQYNDKTYKPNELKKYLLENDKVFEKIKNIDENQTIILLYGRRLKLLSIVPYEEEFSMGINFDPLLKKRYNMKG